MSFDYYGRIWKIDFEVGIEKETDSVIFEDSFSKVVFFSFSFSTIMEEKEFSFFSFFFKWTSEQREDFC